MPLTITKLTSIKDLKMPKVPKTSFIPSSGSQTLRLAGVH